MKKDRYLDLKYLSSFIIARCIGLYIIVVEKLLYEYRPNVRSLFIYFGIFKKNHTSAA